VTKEGNFTFIDCSIDPFFVSSPDKVKVSPVIRMNRRLTKKSTFDDQNIGISSIPLEKIDEEKMRAEIIDIFENDDYSSIECDSPISPDHRREVNL